MAYAGDLSPSSAWDMLLAEPSNTVLIDVRTRPEWAFVGMPILRPDMKAPILEEWSLYPDMSVNEQFASNIAKRLEAEQLDSTTNLLFLCRSGVRSAAAAHAMTDLGFSQCFNIAGGFEGDPNDNGHRGTVNGWKVENLPWRQ